MEIITFGIEIETLIRPKIEGADIQQKFYGEGWNDEQSFTTAESTKQHRSNIEILRYILVEELSRAGYPAHTETESYEEWTVARDLSISEPVEEDGSRPFVGLELISPVQEDMAQAITEIEKEWEIMLETFEVKEHPSCATHIHIGLKESFMDAVPGHRHNCIWAAPNHLCDFTKESATIRQLYAEAEETSHFASLFSFIDEANSIEDLICRAAPKRFLAWNLSNVCRTCKTVEFRRPPQSLKDGDEIHWAKLTVFFVRWVLEANFYDEKSLEPRTNLEGLMKRKEETLMIEGNA